jgi:hypothetical protein
MQVLSAAAKLGFVPAGFFPVVRDANGALVEADCVMVRSQPGAGQVP